jgi:DNA helicase II / ATP-dependent DNA helicase PcrA
MYRTNAQSRVLEEAFVRDNMPYKLVGATSFYGRREIKDVMAYLRVIHNPADEISLNRIINVPRRGIGGKTWEDLRQWGLEHGWQPGEALLALARQPELAHPFAGRAYKALLPLAQQLHRWQQQATQVAGVADLIAQIVRDIDYKSYLEDGTDEGRERWENVQELRNAAVLATGLSLAEFLQEVALVSEVDNLAEGDTAVSLLTLHAAKGLEFPVVFLVGLEDGILPHSRSMDSNDPEDLAEERRLFYVGITRAKDRLFIYHAFQRMAWGRQETATPSRFLRDLPADLVTGGTAAVRREASKQKASSWSWDNDSQSSWGKPSQPSHKPKPSYSWQQAEDDTPKSRVSSQSRVPAAQELPTPNQAREQEDGKKMGMGTAVAQFQTGDKVHHPKFGEGMVITSKMTGADEEVEVTFPGIGVKRLVVSLAKLEKI